MNTYIALLRGINVGGHNKILMADLKVLFEKLNLKNSQTYIQSGNVCFQSMDENTSNLETLINNQILKQYGFDIPVIVKTKKELKSIFSDCPFPEDKKTNSHFMLLKNEPNKELIKQASSIEYQNEEFFITKSCIYFYCSSGYGRTKFNSNFFERKLNFFHLTYF